MGVLSKTKAIFAFALIGTLATAVVTLAFISVPFISELINTLLLSKASSGSGIERAMTISLAFGYFQKYPILGIGWGSATSHDLIVKLLSNVGIVGTVVFSCAIVSIVRANWQKISSRNSPLDLSREVWLLSLVSFVLTSILIEFPFVFGNFWLVVGMCMATGSRSVSASSFSVPIRVKRIVPRAPLRTEI
jgi:O-antigen ligase